MQEEEKIAVHCLKCERSTLGKVIGRHRDNFDPPHLIFRTSFVVCSECGLEMLFQEVGSLIPDEDSDYINAHVEDWSEPSLVFPGKRRVCDLSIPPSVSVGFSEAVKCLSAGAYTASTVMSRRTLEIICKELG